MLALEVDGYTSKEELHGFYLWNTVARNETGIIGSLSNGDEQKKNNRFKSHASDSDIYFFATFV